FFWQEFLYQKRSRPFRWRDENKVILLLHRVDRAYDNFVLEPAQRRKRRDNMFEWDRENDHICLVNGILVSDTTQAAFFSSVLSCSREPTTRSKIVERRIAMPSPISPVPPTIPIFTYPTSGRSRFSNVAASVTPCMVWTTFPSFSIMRVGTTWIPYFCARSICSSTSTFLISMLSPSFFASSSMIGVCIRQGPHHVAKKSYRTGFDIESYPLE